MIPALQSHWNNLKNKSNSKSSHLQLLKQFWKESAKSPFEPKTSPNKQNKLKNPRKLLSNRLDIFTIYFCWNFTIFFTSFVSAPHENFRPIKMLRIKTSFASAFTKPKFSPYRCFATSIVSEKETIVKLLYNIGSRKEVEQYLRHFSSVGKQRLLYI